MKKNHIDFLKIKYQPNNTMFYRDYDGFIENDEEQIKKINLQ
jgi:hypothetical protein